MVASLAKPARAQAAGASLGEWIDGSQGLPCYAYRGPIHFRHHYQTKPMWGLDGEMIPDDPVFLLGNHRLTLFTHASGHIQILSAERAWARMNQGEAIWSGANKATCIVGDSKHELIGLDEAAANDAGKLFGVGFARYSYQLGPGLRVERSIHVRPSAKSAKALPRFCCECGLRIRPRTRWTSSTWKQFWRAIECYLSSRFTIRKLLNTRLVRLRVLVLT